MAGNRKVFEEAMRAAANTAWDEKWDQAIEAYRRALREFPDDVSALTSLGLAYSGAGQLEAALDAYQRASDLKPHDPVLLERIGKTRQRLGQREAAAKAYLASAERYLSQQQAAPALDRCRDAAKACPDSTEVRAQLLQYYERLGQVSEAVEECLGLARICHDSGRDDRAAELCQRALGLAPRDSRALALLDSLDLGGQPAVKPEANVREEQAEPLAGIEQPPDLAALGFGIAPEIGTDEQQGSLIEVTRQNALADLAESVFDAEEPAAPSGAAPWLDRAEVDALIGRAIDFQTRGRTEEAIAAYEQVIVGKVERPAVHFNLGLLYQEKLRYEDAIVQFERAVSQPRYRVGGHLALGECHRAQGRANQAQMHFIEAVKTLDLATVKRGQAGELRELYEDLADGYIGERDEDEAIQSADSLASFLGDQDWAHKVVQARQWLDALTGEGPPISLAEALTIPRPEDVLESLALSQEYVERGMFYAALEECYCTLDQAPNYLPIHRQLAHVLLAMGKVDEAVAKLVVIADTCRRRGNLRHAMAMYGRALKLAPMDGVVRARLIHLLIGRGEIEKALEQYLMLADGYYHLAQMDQAREVYQEALELAARSDAGPRWTVRILHEMGDIDMQRVDWKRAIRVYERIRDAAPDDERARLTLVELYYRFNQPRLAIDELDGLLGTYRKSGDLERVLLVLRHAVQKRPDSIALRARLAQAYLNGGDAEKALKHLDKLGELQLEAGRHDDMKATVRAIIALHPPNVAEYQDLLNRLN